VQNENQRLSVALCTFDGERYLADQLRSLIEQSRRPDEVVICDDGSRDRTVQIVEQFAADAPFPVRLHRNPTKLGPAENFAQAMSLCTGQIISFCDQDDIWRSDKIELTVSAFERDPRVAYVFSDADICDVDCRPLGYRLWTSIGFVGRLRQQFDSGGGFDVLLRQNVVSGATLSFAARYRPLLLPIGAGWMHDGWIALLLSAIGTGRAIPQPLTRYRQHPNQSIGAARRSLYQQYLNARKMDRDVFDQQAVAYQAALDRLTGQTDAPAGALEKLQSKIAHCQTRSAIRHRKINRIPAALGELLTMRYRRFSLGWKSFSQDLFL